MVERHTRGILMQLALDYEREYVFALECGSSLVLVLTSCLSV